MVINWWNDDIMTRNLQSFQPSYLLNCYLLVFIHILLETCITVARSHSLVTTLLLFWSSFDWLELELTQLFVVCLYNQSRKCELDSLSVNAVFGLLHEYRLSFLWTHTQFFRVFLGWNQRNLMFVKMNWRKWNMKMEFLSRGKCSNDMS